MGVIDVHGQSDFNAKLRGAGGKLVVVDFTATWCGPCQYIKPTFHQWANEYDDVVFLEVNEAHNEDVIHSVGIRGFPTFHLYINSQKVDELVGADVNSLKRKIDTWRASAGYNPFASEGVALGNGGATWEDPREARLRKFNQDASAALRTLSPPAPVAAPSLTEEEEQKEDEELAKALLLSQQELQHAQADQAAHVSGEPNLEIPPVNEEFLGQLTEMGFPEVRARKSLLATNDQNSLEAAISWIEEHEGDADIDAPIQFIDLAKQRKVLTTEEKEAKVAELKRRIEEKKVMRAAQSKKDEIAREIARRNMGKEMASAKEEYDAIQTRLMREKQAREKLEAKRERERLLKQIELDKAERRAHNGKLTAATSLDAPEPVTAAAAAPAHSPAKPVAAPEVDLETNVNRLSQYRVGNDGLTALKTLLVYVTKLLENPTELDKYGRINSTNAAFKKRVGSLIGGTMFLRGIGFEKEVDGDYLVLREFNGTRLRDAQRLLERAIDAYHQNV
ncbi:hypothetical protein H310_09534 [Aphanomyces invadans]|uniref:Thioredoxin n=1 Tax=Aphanomyces invadans TaxID=157072 RepID=A0A024TUD6_9STRA|nr:hypothetical protein H310_09534 [Aphanomyces invadans]ETV97643.1 hypothetical protein H310_09534 [Aphanomyces invadans]|eukprot:XP_008873852.1 hypothetical protein H310_09534 [Aphanomyces invadans]